MRHAWHPDARDSLRTRVRLSATFYFDPLDGNGFDTVINPVILEPVVQFTLYLKVTYEVAR